MLDAEDYPHAFLEVHGMRLELRRVSKRSDGLHADVKIGAVSSESTSVEKHLPRRFRSQADRSVRTSPLCDCRNERQHNSLDRALEIVECTGQAGAHAIKLQTYTADTMTLDARGGSFEINDPTPLVGPEPARPQRHTPLGMACPDYGSCTRVS